MKTVLRYGKFFAFCVFTCYFFSCTSSKMIAPKDKKKLVIRITGSDTTTGNLTMIDEDNNPADSLQAWSGQKIKWDIEDDNVKSIDSISPKPTSSSIFNDQPAKITGSKNWQGKLKTTSTILLEEYNIYWKDKPTKSVHKFDPKIQLNPS